MSLICRTIPTILLSPGRLAGWLAGWPRSLKISFCRPLEIVPFLYQLLVSLGHFLALAAVRALWEVLGWLAGWLAGCLPVFYNVFRKLEPTFS